MSDYDKLAPPQQADPYDTLLQNESGSQRSALQQSMFAASQTNPDARATAVKASRVTGIPVEVAERQPELASKRAVTDGAEYDRLLEGSPGTAGWLTTPENAAVAHDDTPALTESEKAWKDYGFGIRMVDSVYAGIWRLQGNLITLPGALYGMATQTKPPDWMMNREVADREAERFTPPDIGRSVSGELSQGNYSRAGQALAMQFAANAPSQVAVLVSAIFGSPGMGLAVAGSTQASDAYKKSLDAGVSPQAASANALIQGAVEAGFENIGTFGLLKGWSQAIAKEYGKDAAGQVMKDFSKTLLHTVASEGTEEGMTSIAQDLSDYLTGVNPDALQGLGQRALDAGILGGLSGGLITSPAGAAHGYVRMSELKKADLARNTYLAMGESLGASKLRKRLPEAQRNFVESVTKDGPVSDIYIPVEALTKYFQSKDIEPFQAMQDAGVGDVYAQAVKSGSDVQIPTATFTDKFLDTEHFKGLSNDIKFNPADLTPRQADEVREQMKAEAQKTQAQVDQVDEDVQFAPYVEKLQGELQKAGVEKSRVEAFSDIFKRGMTALAKAGGTKTTELAERFGLSVAQEDAGARQVSPLQQQWSGLTPEEKQSRFYHDPVTGTLNEAAFNNLAPPPGKPLVAHISFEGGKFLNDNISHDAADAAYRYFGQALASVDPNVAKVGPDFATYVSSQAELEDLLAKAKELLPARMNLDGQVVASDSLQLTGAVAQSREMAGEAHGALKVGLEAKGERATRGDQPLNYRLSQGEAPAQQVKRPALAAELLEAFPKSDRDAFLGANYDVKSGMLSDAGYRSLAKKKGRSSIDLNGLKIINDAYGKRAGDAMLRAFEAITLATSMKPEYAGIDIAHKSGDEYLAQHDNIKLLHKFWLEVEQSLDKLNFKIPDKAGNLKVKSGLTLGAGIGGTDAIAEQELKRGKVNIAAERTPERILGSVYGQEPGADGDRGDGVQRQASGVSARYDGAPAAGGEQGGVQRLAQAKGKDEDARGYLEFGPDKQRFKLALLKDMDDSTFIHEMGHYFLEIMESLADAPAATDTLKNDFETIREWTGGKEKLTEAQREKFARGFEAYLMEGKAPSSALRRAFARARVWLTAIYRQVQSLGVKISPEIKGVFDRLLATQEEIGSAESQMNREPLFEDAKAAGMTDAQAQRYVDARQDARAEAEENLTSEVMREYNRSRQAFWKEKEAEIRGQVEAEVNDLPIYKAIDQLQAKTEGGDSLRLDEAAIPKDLLKKLPKDVTAKGGANPDVMANILGWKSGAALLNDLVQAPKKKRLVDQMVDGRMAEAFPELMNSPEFPEKALKAVHNDHSARVMRMELEHLAAENLSALGSAIKGVARRVPPVAAVREAARRSIGDRHIRDIKPHLYQQAEIRAAREAGQLLAKGDVDGAFAAKQRELLNHELYRASMDARQLVEDALEGFKDLAKPDATLAKSRDMDLVNAARAVLAQHGIGKSDKSAADYLEPLKQYDQDTYDAMRSMVDALAGQTVNYTDMPLSDFQSMADSVDALWTLAKTSRQIKIGDEIMDIEDVRATLKQRLAEVTEPGKRTGYDKAKTKWDRTKMFLLGMRASLRRVESWVDAVDGDEGPKHFRDMLLRPVLEATSNYRLAKKSELLKYLDLTKKVQEFVKGPNILSPELGYEFTRTELLGALTHSGNDSNLGKLLRGRGWGGVDEQGNLDRTRWDAFIKRLQAEKVLTKTEYDFVQSVWDLLEEIKPLAQKAHKQMYGHFFSEVAAQEIDTPWGKYRGGYMPAVVDPFLSSDAATRQEKQSQEEFNNSFMFPTTGRGFTKTRVESYAKPLAIDLRMVPSHIDKVLRFVHIEPSVKNANRLVLNPGVRAALDDLDTGIGGDMLTPWLQRAATQRIEAATQGWGGKGLDIVFREVRKRTGMQVLTANVTNALQQLGGFSVAALKVKPKYLRDSLWSMMKAPAKTTEMIVEKSDFMRTRSTAGAIEVMAELDDILLNPGPFEKLQDFAKKHGHFMTAGTQNFVDKVTWAGAYDQAVERGLEEKEAVLEADAAVRQTQGSFNPEDVSRFESGTPVLRALTMFYSYFNMQANILGSEFTKITRDMGLRKGAGRGLYAFAFGFMIPAIVSEMIIRTLAGGGDEDDDDYMSNLMAIFFGSQFNNLAAMVPGGSVVKAGVNMWNDKPYDDRISVSPAISMVESAVRAPHSVYQAIVNDKSKKTAVRDTLTALGMLLSLPLTPLAKPIGYALDVQEGKKEPSGTVDLIRGLATGK